MSMTSTKVSRELISQLLHLPADVLIESVYMDTISKDFVLLLSGGVPNCEWSQIIVHKEYIRVEFKPLEIGKAP